MPASEFKVEKFNLRISDSQVQIRRNNGAARTEKFCYDERDLDRRTLSMLADMRRNGRLEGSEVNILGEWLYRLLLEHSYGQELHKAISDASVFLRVELEFENPSGSLATLPWEYLRRPAQQDTRGYFLATHDQIALMRLPQVECRPLAATEKKPKILFVASSPANLDPLVFRQFINKVRQLRALNCLVLATPSEENKKQKAATFENFQQALKKFKPHIVHFLGHGEYDSGVGKIAFVQPGNDKADWKTGEEIAQELKDCASVMLAFLQACETAAEDSHDSNANWSDKYQALSSVAGCVVQVSHVPAIVAMQAKVENMSANTFARTFYRSLVEHKPIYRAIQIARAEARKAEQAGDTAEHFSCVPVLYLDTGGKNDDGILFPESDKEVSQSTEQAGKRPTSIPCPWCPKVIEISPYATREPERCSKCGNLLRCPKCHQPINKVDPDDDKVFCTYENCDGEIHRRKSKTEDEPPVPKQGDGFDKPKTRGAATNALQ